MRQATAARLDLRIIALLGALFPMPPHAGTGPLVFRSGFEDPPSALACPTAQPLAEGSGGAVNASIDPPGDVDYYALDVVAGGWFFLDVAANELNDPALLDSVLTVYGADGASQLARNDDAVGSGGLDSFLYYRAAQAGTLCIGVEDWSTAFGTTPEGGPDFDYAFGAFLMDFDDPGLNLDAGGNGTTAMPQALDYFTNSSNGQYTAVIAGDFDAAGDVDVYALEAPAGAERMTVVFGPTGVNGYGGTTPLGVVELLDASGSTVIGRLDVRHGADALSLPAAANTTYLLRVDAPPEALGNNPFYVLDYGSTDVDNPQEANDAGNDIAAGAEVASPLAIPGRTSHFIGGTLDVADTDWWSFQAGAGNDIAVFCASQRNGSGVLDLTVALFDDPVAAPLQQGVETAFADLAWAATFEATQPPVTTTQSGTHYLRLDATNFSGTVTDRHYQCGIHVFGDP